MIIALVYNWNNDASGSLKDSNNFWFPSVNVEFRNETGLVYYNNKRVLYKSKPCSLNIVKQSNKLTNPLASGELLL